MTKSETITLNIKQQGILPLFYHDDPAICLAIMKTLYEAGVRSVEFTNRGKNALENFKTIVSEKAGSMPELLLGIGTIKTGEEATAYIRAGADFLVSPVFDYGVADIASHNKILWIPGCMTPSEIHTAQKAGCSLIKLFPGNLLGQGFVEAISPLFSGLEFIVTGGVDTTEENISAWFKTGVIAVGLGTKLITKEILETFNYEKLKAKTLNVLEIVKKIKTTG